jgi:SRSO17 transposase
MTEQEISRIGPEFSVYLGRYRNCFLQDRTATHFDNFCRGLLADLPRKSVEPIALECGTAVRTLQAFLTTSKWDHEQARVLVQRRAAAESSPAQMPAAPSSLGRVGVIDETSAVKKGDQTPGVQRQYCGAVGKIENCIVTVHVAIVAGEYKTVLDADLYLPESWHLDRERCRDAGIPDDVVYRAKWEIARDQLIRAAENDIHFDWLTFDEGYGGKVPFLEFLNEAKQRFVAEIPRSFSVRTTLDGVPRRADEIVSTRKTSSWRRFRLARQTLGHHVWRAKALQVWTAGRRHRLIVAINEATGEVKYFLSNARNAGVKRNLRVAFMRWNVEHLFRVAKQEVGLMHFEGREYIGLIRHLILGLVVMGFVSSLAARKRGEKPADHARTDLPSAQQPLPSPDASPSRHPRERTSQPNNLLPSAA